MFSLHTIMFHEHTLLNARVISGNWAGGNSLGKKLKSAASLTCSNDVDHIQWVWLHAPDICNLYAGTEYSVRKTA